VQTHQPKRPELPCWSQPEDLAEPLKAVRAVPFPPLLSNSVRMDPQNADTLSASAEVDSFLVFVPYEQSQQAFNAANILSTAIWRKAAGTVSPSNVKTSGSRIHNSPIASIASEQPCVTLWMSAWRNG
jgi:hypothetical protein